MSIAALVTNTRIPRHVKREPVGNRHQAAEGGGGPVTPRSPDPEVGERMSFAHFVVIPLT